MDRYGSCCSPEHKGSFGLMAIGREIYITKQNLGDRFIICSIWIVEKEDRMAGGCITPGHPIFLRHCNEKKAKQRKEKLIYV